MTRSVFPVVSPSILTVGDLLDILNDIPKDAIISFSQHPIELQKLALQKIYLVNDVPIHSTIFDEGLTTRYLHFVLF